MSKSSMDASEPSLNEDVDLEDLDPGNDVLMSSRAFEWLQVKEKTVRSPSPMDTIVVVKASENYTEVDQASDEFSRKKMFEAASKGDPGPLRGLQEHLQRHSLKLTSPEYIDEYNGKTALLKAVLNLNDGKNDTIQVLLDISETCGDLEEFVNAAYNDQYYKGQTALHVAIERRSFDQVKLLVQKGADVQAKANGAFFQLNSKQGFYFGELPLSLAACTNQSEVVSFLMDNQYRCANSRDRDSWGNTVLHALVIADNTEENTDFIIQMYDEVLIRDTRMAQNGEVPLEAIENNKGLTPLKLAAKLGKIGLFRHIVQREFTDDETRALSRKFTDWIYGPIRSSLYDMTSIDTSEDHSVLEIIVFGSAIENRQEMLQVEPLCSLLEEKWNRFASKLFMVSGLFYLVYLGIFTTIAFHWKEGQPPFPQDITDGVRSAGELITVLGAVYIFIKAIVDFKRKPPRMKSMHIDGFNEMSFFLQATLLLVSVVVYACGSQEYVGPFVISLALAWINILYYSRGFRHMGMYNVMIQRIILSDVIRFLIVYLVFLYGFSVAIVSFYCRVQDYPPDHVQIASWLEGQKPTYNITIRQTALELFKLTIGMGNLEFSDERKPTEVFYILVMSYTLLTYIMLFNMLIALMSETVERVYRESENIWRLQRSMTILDLERMMPRSLLNRLQAGIMKELSLGSGQESRSFFRVEEVNWKKWRTNLGIMKEEDSESEVKPEPLLLSAKQRSLWNMSPLFSRLRSRRSTRSELHDTVI